METFDAKTHWENIYSKKALTEVSWYQKTPQLSLSYLKAFDIPKDAKIIDVGGGDSFFVDHLLDLGYSHVTVLDISEKAIERAKARLGERAHLVDWIVGDASTFNTEVQYDFWHDRAAFHFLKSPEDIDRYKKNVNDYVTKNGIVVIGTFSLNGPLKCSGIEIFQYSEESLAQCFSFLDKIDSKIHQHTTPFDTVQEFVFCSFRKTQ